MHSTNIRVGTFFIPWLLAGFVSAGQDNDLPESEPVLSGQASLSYVQTTGNSNANTLGSGINILLKKSLWSLESKGSFIQTHSKGESIVRQLTTSVRGEREIKGNFLAFSQVSYLKNVFTDIDDHVSLDIGGVYRPLKTDRQTLSLRLAGSRTHERLQTSLNPIRDFWGGGAIVSYQLSINEAANLVDETDYRYEFFRADNWRASNSAILTLTISRVLAVKISHQLYYSNNPGSAVRKTDTTFLVSLSALWPKSKD